MTEPWWRTVWSMLKQLPDFIADRIADGADRVLLSPHDPEDVMGDGSEAWCVRCKTQWPCDEYVRISDRRRDRRAAAGKGARP